MNAIVRRNLTGGGGLFTLALEKELAKRGMDVPFVAHDLVGELDGKGSGVNVRYLVPEGRPA